MAIIKELNGVMPEIGPRAFIAESAAIIGSVTWARIAASGTALCFVGMWVQSGLVTE